MCIQDEETESILICVIAYHSDTSVIEDFYIMGVFIHHLTKGRIVGWYSIPSTPGTETGILEPIQNLWTFPVIQYWSYNECEAL